MTVSISSSQVPASSLASLVTASGTQKLGANKSAGIDAGTIGDAAPASQADGSIEEHLSLIQTGVSVTVEPGSPVTAYLVDAGLSVESIDQAGSHVQQPNSGGQLSQVEWVGLTESPSEQETFQPVARDGNDSGPPRRTGKFAKYSPFQPTVGPDIHSVRGSEDAPRALPQTPGATPGVVSIEALDALSDNRRPAPSSALPSVTAVDVEGPESRQIQDPPKANHDVIDHWVSDRPAKYNRSAPADVNLLESRQIAHQYQQVDRSVRNPAAQAVASTNIAAAGVAAVQAEEYLEVDRPRHDRRAPTLPTGNLAETGLGELAPFGGPIETGNPPNPLFTAADQVPADGLAEPSTTLTLDLDPTVELLAGADDGLERTSLLSGQSAEVVTSKLNFQSGIRVSEAGQIQFTNEVAEQIVHRLQTTTEDGTTTIKLRINPPELGAISVSLEQTERSINVQIHADSSLVGNLLENNIKQLMDTLRMSDYGFADVEVSWDDGTQDSQEWARQRDADERGVGDISERGRQHTPAEAYPTPRETNANQRIDIVA